MKNIIFFFLFLFSVNGFSQETIIFDSTVIKNELLFLKGNSKLFSPSINNKGVIKGTGNSVIKTNATANNNAALEIRSTNKGFLMPRMSTNNRISIDNPVENLFVYDSTKNNILYFSGKYGFDVITEYNSELENLITKNIGDSLFWVEFPVWKGFLSGQKTEIVEISKNDTLVIEDSYKEPTIWVQIVTGSDTTYSLLDNVSCLEDSFYVKEIAVNTDSLGFTYTDGYIWLSKDTSISEVVVAENDTVIDMDLHEIYWDAESTTFIKTANFQCVEKDVNYELRMNNLAQRFFSLIWKDPDKTILIEKF